MTNLNISSVANFSLALGDKVDFIKDVPRRNIIKDKLNHNVDENIDNVFGDGLKGLTGDGIISKTQAAGFFRRIQRFAGDPTAEDDLHNQASKPKQQQAESQEPIEIQVENQEPIESRISKIACYSSRTEASLKPYVANVHVDCLPRKPLLFADSCKILPGSIFKLDVKLKENSQDRVIRYLESCSKISLTSTSGGSKSWWKFWEWKWG